MKDLAISIIVWMVLSFLGMNLDYTELIETHFIFYVVGMLALTFLGLFLIKHY